MRITLLVDDAELTVQLAVAEGGTINLPLGDMFWGGRYAKIWPVRP